MDADYISIISVLIPSEEEERAIGMYCMLLYLTSIYVH